MTRIQVTSIALCTFALAGCPDEEERTQVMVVVEADRAVRLSTRRVDLLVFGGDRGNETPDQDEQLVPVNVNGDDSAWPLTHALVPRNGDQSRLFRVEARALDENLETLAFVRAISGYLEKRTLALRLRFYTNCLYVSPCEDPDLSCGPEGNCSVVVNRPPGELDTFDPENVGSTEPECSGPIDCDDQVLCTEDACVDGACVNVPLDNNCDAAPDGSCDAENGCQYGSSCTDSTCRPEGCETASCENNICVRRVQCRIGQECCGGACVAVGCNDGNPCTDDSCGNRECVHAPNDNACDDGTFCNGPDRCGGGSCSVSEGNPCSGGTQCDETGRTCAGCTDEKDCPDEMIVVLTSCAPNDPCSDRGTQQVNVTSYTCSNGDCVSSSAVETRTCILPPVTDGTPCGSSNTEWSGVCDPLGQCATEGTEFGMRTDLICDSGSCVQVQQSDQRACTPPPDPGCEDGGICTQGETGFECEDGRDNDCDGDFDCEDTQCALEPVCSGGGTDAGPPSM